MQTLIRVSYRWSPREVLLCVSETQLHWLPVHGFQGADSLERFAELVKGKVQDYKDER